MNTEEWVREWRFRSLIPLTHAAYLDEPAQTVDWLLTLQAAEQQEKARRGR